MTTVKWHGCCSSVGVAKQFVRTALADFDEAQALQLGNDLMRFEDWQ
jgi:hypothetical protein